MVFSLPFSMSYTFLIIHSVLHDQIPFKAFLMERRYFFLLESVNFFQVSQPKAVVFFRN